MLMPRRNVDLDYLRGFDPLVRPLALSFARGLARVAFRWPRPLRLEVDTSDGEVPRGPAIFAQNHTHEFDFLPVRYALYERWGLHLVTWIKCRAFQHPLQARMLELCGNLPFASRGFLLSADFRSVYGRKPNEGEYRQIRLHWEQDTPLTSDLQRLGSQPRNILGRVFDPTRESYRESLNEVYRQAMEATLEGGRRALTHGHCPHIYPQGTYSSRLTPGRIGLVQASLALDLPVYLVGCSGMNDCFWKDLPLQRGGLVRIRISGPHRVDRSGLGADYVPFSPGSEVAYRAVLQAKTETLMRQLNELLEGDCNFVEGFAFDGKEGVGRFL